MEGNENTSPNGSTSGENPSGGTPNTQPQTQQRDPVPYERFQEVSRSNRELKAQLGTFEARIKELEGAAAEAGTLRGQLTRRQVADEFGLPGDLADHILGDTPEAMKASAERLKKFVGKPTPPSTGGGDKGDTPQTFTTTQLLDSDFYWKHKDAILKAQKEGRIVQD